MRIHRFYWPVIAAKPEDTPTPPLWSRLLWLAGIWAASTGALLGVAMVLRWVLKA